MLNRRIRNKEQEVPVEQTTSTPIQDIKVLGPKTLINKLGKEEVKYQYEILGQVLSSNKELGEYELENIKNTLKNLI